MDGDLPNGKGKDLEKRKFVLERYYDGLKKKVHILDVVIIIVIVVGLCQYFFASNRIQNLIREVLKYHKTETKNPRKQNRFS